MHSWHWKWSFATNKCTFAIGFWSLHRTAPHRTATPRYLTPCSCAAPLSSTMGLSLDTSSHLPIDCFWRLFLMMLWWSRDCVFVWCMWLCSTHSPEWRDSERRRRACLVAALAQCTPWCVGHTHVRRRPHASGCDTARIVVRRMMRRGGHDAAQQVWRRCNAISRTQLRCGAARVGVAEGSLHSAWCGGSTRRAIVVRMQARRHCANAPRARRGALCCHDGGVPAVRTNPLARGTLASDGPGC